MSQFWRKVSKSTLPSSYEDPVREKGIAESLLASLGQAVKSLQVEHLNNSNQPIITCDDTNTVCSVIEAMFIHGLKETFLGKMTSILTRHNPDQGPEPNFWPFLLIFTHKDVINQVQGLTQIRNDTGRCRAWIRVALSECILDSYLSAIAKDRSSLRTYYRKSAFLRDPDLLDLTNKHLQGLSAFEIKLAYNSSALNVWTSTPLMLAGIWIPTVPVEPDYTGIDIASCYEEPKLPQPRLRLMCDSACQAGEAGLTNTLSSNSGSVSMTTEFLDRLYGPGNLSDESKLNSTEESVTVGERFGMLFGSSTSSNPTMAAPGAIMAYELTGTTEGVASTSGNDVTSKDGWSSSIEEIENDACGRKITAITAPIAIQKSESFKTLLLNYTPASSNVCRTPDASDILSDFGSRKPLSQSNSTGSLSDQDPKVASDNNSVEEDVDFEVVPRNVSVLDNDKEVYVKELSDLLGVISTERGLDSQGFQCKSCSRSIGMIYGKPKVCSFDGCSYCEDCHADDEMCIPARIIHNWDFKRYKVCKRTANFLSQINDLPLLDIRTINHRLYDLVTELKKIQLLRSQLSFLRCYLFTCREAVANELRKKIWPREYLYEHIHLYALSDFHQIGSGVLSDVLSKSVQFALKHVVDECRLCCQKGFVCEICQDAKVIYPFQLDITHRCAECMAVFHKFCMADKRPCPRCERRLARRQRLNSATGSELVDSDVSWITD